MDQGAGVLHDGEVEHEIQYDPGCVDKVENKIQCDPGVVYKVTSSPLQIPQGVTTMDQGAGVLQKGVIEIEIQCDRDKSEGKCMSELQSDTNQNVNCSEQVDELAMCEKKKLERYPLQTLQEVMEVEMEQEFYRVIILIKIRRS